MPLELCSPPMPGHSLVFISHRIIASSSLSPSETDVTTPLHVCVSTPVRSVWPPARPPSIVVRRHLPGGHLD